MIATLFVTSLLCFSFAIDPVSTECKLEGNSCIEKTL